MIDEIIKDSSILDQLHEMGYELAEGRKGFKLHLKTEIGSGDIFFSKHNGKIYGSYKIKNPDGEIIQKGSKEFGGKMHAEEYLVTVCCEIYFQLGLE